MTIREVTQLEMQVAITNMVKSHFPTVRQTAKSPYFLLMYGGSWRGLMSEYGFSEKVSKGIENGFHNLFREFDEFIATAIVQAHIDGYVTGCFNLRLYTPIMHQTKYKGKHGKQYLAESEARTAGNLVGGQSYCMLTLRALGDFMKRVYKSKWRNDIAPISTIYDSIYLDVPHDYECLEWCNKNLIECMCNIHGVPELKHPSVKVGANLCIYYPDWSNEMELKNNIGGEEIRHTLETKYKEYISA